MSLIYRLFRLFEKHRLKKVSELITGDDLAVLEIGCGDGSFLYQNRHHFKLIYGVDLNPKLLTVAKIRNYGVASKFQTDDFGKKPMKYKSSQFDLVVSIATLQYVYDLDLLFSEVGRVLKPSGLFIFEVPNLAVFWRRIELLLGKFPRTTEDRFGWDGGVIHYFTSSHLLPFLRQKGFTVERTSCSGILDNLREKWTSFLGADLIFVCRNNK